MWIIILDDIEIDRKVEWTVNIFHTQSIFFLKIDNLY